MSEAARDNVDRSAGPGGEPRPAPAPFGPPGTRPHDRERRRIADRITEDVMQLLYTARQDLAELDAQGPDADPALVRSAHDCIAGAISILRSVVSTVLSAAWGPAPGEPPDQGWGRTASVLFDVLGDAWIITCQDDDLLYASRAACEVLGRPSDELATLMRRRDSWTHRLTRVPRAAGPSGEVEFVVGVPLEDGGVRPVHVTSHPLPAAADAPPSYISRLTVRET
jgi:PAS domain-containing protein